MLGRRRRTSTPRTVPRVQPPLPIRITRSDEGAALVHEFETEPEPGRFRWASDPEAGGTFSDSNHTALPPDQCAHILLLLGQAKLRRQQQIQFPGGRLCALSNRSELRRWLSRRRRSASILC